LDVTRGGSESNRDGELVAADCDGKILEGKVKVNAGEHPVRVVRVQRKMEVDGDCVFEQCRNDGKFSFAEAGGGFDGRE
jgi:cytoskeletal protein CcmA (bactofilin family)